MVKKKDDHKPDEIQQGEGQSLTPLEEQTKAPVQAGGWPCGRNLCRRGPEALPWIHSHTKEGQWNPGLHQAGHCQPFKEGDPFPATQQWWNHTWSSGPSFGLPCTRQAWTHRHCDDEEIGASVTWAEAERAGMSGWIRIGSEGKGCTNSCREGAIGLGQVLFSGA